MKRYVIVLLHIGYWIMYFVVISMFSLIDTHGEKIEVIHPAFVGSIIAACLGFYTFYGIFFEKYFAKQKHLKLLLATLLLVFLFAPPITEILVYLIYSISPFKFHPGFEVLFKMGLCVSFLAFTNGILGLVMKGFITWCGEIKLKEELNRKNYEMELALMKAQINPHFLFNTINNIDGLIKVDSDKASDYLNKLSDIMRFMLYETKTERIPLVKELSYIEKYIELQKIRTTNQNFVKYEVNGDPGTLQIESMLFIPFIENAFKHTEDKKIEDAIRIYFLIEKDKITFECENKYSEEIQLKPEYCGLGNELIEKRLLLLYKDKHTFKIENANGLYKVKLTLPL
jgi:two-component system LytT family sensor kinase